MVSSSAPDVKLNNIWTQYDHDGHIYYHHDDHSDINQDNHFVVQRLVLHSTTSGLTSDLGTLLDSLTALQITPS